jgi:DnaD/phage-associated family protein
MLQEPFRGFPTRSDFTPIPTLFLTRLMLQTEDTVELKVSLYLMQALYHKKGYPRFIGSRELAADSMLMAALDSRSAPPGEILRRALEAAVARGVFLRVQVTDSDGRPDELYLLNDEPGRRALKQWQSGNLALPAVASLAMAPAPAGSRPNIFSLYEENIGVLTPIVAEELRAAEKEYPADWIEDAFREAATLNKRNWRYIARILENWSIEGRAHGKPGGRTQRKRRPEDYYKGKFGHLIRR